MTDLTTRDSYQPSALARTETRKDGERWTLVFVRDLKHPPGKVWTTLTDPAHVREWAPYDVDRNLGTVGPIKLTMIGGPTSEVLDGSVRRAEAPKLLEYTWGEDVLRWQLESTTSGTRLTLEHTLEDRNWLPKVAAGWHICLDVAEQALSGHPIGRIVGGEAKRFGWELLNAKYAEKLGIENTGWPANVTGG